MVTQGEKALLGRIQQQLVAKQVGTGVARHTQLGQHNDARTRLYSAVHTLDDVLHIAVNIGHIHLWHNCCHSHKAIIGHRLLLRLCHILAIFMMV